MTFSRLLLSSVLACSVLAMPASAQITNGGEVLAQAKSAVQPRIQIALLLDTSNSMDGLIAQTKSQLWTLVNELAEGKKNGQTPIIELALYEYGNSTISVSKGYIRQVLSLTTDLDDVSEKLFALSTNGGQEYAGQVLTKSLDELEWSGHKDDMKLIIIAGNEPFTQGSVTWQSACERAKSKGVIIDTIHCGDADTGMRTGWKDAADCAGGIYMTINQDEKYVHVPSPWDDTLLDLNKKLNDTYYGYGAKGVQYKTRQAMQDSNASTMNKGAEISRLYSKSKSNYTNESWDIVDAYKKDKDAVMKMAEDKLPEELRGKTANERKAFIEAKQAERAQIQKQIAELGKKQKAFVAEKRKQMAATNTLDNVMVKAVRKQAAERGFKY
ncbi:MAG: VWA domain-containing protein [Robiginitomaculum sp.]|nr:VWA domain-containing protein [Robiginitomaculum sp.]